MTAVDVARLNRSEPPPGYYVSGVETFALEGFVYFGREFSEWHGRTGTKAEAVEATWAHYQEHNDPLGLDEEEWHDAVDALGRERARAAAWAWYWRRVAVSMEVDMPRLVERAMVLPDPRPVSYWPRCLTWSDEQVAGVERWLAEGGEVPEVLRAG